MPDIDLSTISFFSGFDRDALDKIAAMGEAVEAERGAVIMEQGEVGREAFVVVDGEVQIIVNGHVVGTAGRGSVLGEMALLDLRPRSATLVALTDVELISYASKQFRKILDEMPADARAALNERDERFRAENLEIGFDDDRPRPPGH
ncbi:MAG TPA: cyclic nucleotide-binding domain-containing protein [Acidimicrobiales bacterium]|nr:cyclic nucleotide-binding domain-containing protein [Acidimicrobiales bacterium]